MGGRAQSWECWIRLCIDSFVYSVEGKMAAGCAVLYIRLFLCAIDCAAASVYYLNVKMSVLVITGSIKRQAARPQPQTCREPRQADELLRRG